MTRQKQYLLVLENKNINLYNKYRPKTFKEVIGQNVVKTLLLQTFKREKLLQSFLFYGSHGTGKTSLARIFAKAWNCKNFEKLGDVCNECKACKLINEARTTDIYEVDAASHSGVEHVRELTQNSQYMPLDLSKKIYLIDECHNLSSAAWNALLKAIEEPYSENVIFIFLTTNISKIPETILSRCQKYSFSRLSDEELFELIDLVAEKEGRKLVDGAKKLLVGLSQGSARECLSLIEQVFLTSDSEKEVDVKHIETVFALANKDDQLKFLNLLVDCYLTNSEDIKSQLIVEVEKSVVHSKNLLNYFVSILGIFMDIYIYELTRDSNLLKILSLEEVNKFAFKGIDYLRLCDVVNRSVDRYNFAYSKGDWAKIAVLHMLPFEQQSLQQQSLPVKNGEIVNSSDDLSLPEDVKYKFMYGIKKENQDKTISAHNYETYCALKNKNDLPADLKEVLLKKCCFPKNLLASTNRTVIFIFQEKKDADAFNELLKKKPEYVDKLNNLFIGNFFWIGTTTQQILLYKEEMKTVDQSKINEAFSLLNGNDKFETMLKILTE
ncbi:DNA polymerase III subunit gamma/tau [Candidatus Mycoplasma haematohominis]|uniref:DNA polymerase III subunit gamma/tau n=1 Tax=Candidatus Mycoplasma haematohominis TaxID=1494318 RepID=UPI001C0A67F3|nr:DNA polymerase III subunit gamma/tau [Candidatus Mycoplasma haemohominis]